VKIAGMVVWVLTAGIGVYLLAVGIAGNRKPAGRAQPAAGDRESAPVMAEATVVGAAALASGMVMPGGSVSTGTGAEGGESPLLEFVHPLLALTGLTFWIFFVMTDDRLFAWIGFAVVVTAVLAGLSWLLSSHRGSRGGHAGGPGFPGHLVTLHGLAAACTLALVVISAVTATHG
jgi:hypothetical protein